MNEFWVARDAIGVVMTNREPVKCEKLGTYHVPGAPVDAVAIIPDSWFPDLLPGQCRRLVMESEASE